MSIIDNTLVLGILIFIARVLDVTIGTIRTISIIHGRSWVAFFLGFIEVTMWLAVISVLVPLINEKPILVLFYALGFSTGNVVGINVERRLSLGNGVLQLFARQDGSIIVDALRTAGYAVTVMSGKGKESNIDVIYSVGTTKKLHKILHIAQQFEPNIFYVSTPTGSVRRMKDTIVPRATGWRAVFKRK